MQGSQQYAAAGKENAFEAPTAPGAVTDPLELTEVIYDWNLATDEITWGPGFAEILGFADPFAASSGLAYAEHLAPESPTSRFEAIMSAGGCDTGGGVPFKATYGLVPSKRSKASPVWVEDSGRWFADAADRPCRAHGVVRIITKRFEAERLMLMASQRDSETGTFTRAHFLEHIARHLSLASRKQSTFVVLLLGFVSEADGEMRPEGRDMVEAVSALRSQMRSHEMLARYAPTKFAALLESCNEDQAVAAAYRLIATNAGQPCRDGAPLRVRIGGVLSPCHGRTPQALMQFAEEALEAARQTTSPPYVLYHPQLMKTRRSGLEAPDEVMTALHENRVVLALQPVVDARTRSTAFFEGLVRVRRSNGMLLMPDALVPMAEKNGIVQLIDRRVIDLAFSLLNEAPDLALSINASVASLQDPSWLDHLRASCKLRPGAARRLTVEITETCAIADIEATRATLAAIKPLGVKIALDDFGSGHSSFRNLRKLPIDYLKIDGAFAQNLANSPDDRFFIRTLIDLARNLGIPTVAEWVEDEATAQILADWGVTYLQGHLFGRAEIGLHQRRGSPQAAVS